MLLWSLELQRAWNKRRHVLDPLFVICFSFAQLGVKVGTTTSNAFHGFFQLGTILFQAFQIIFPVGAARAGSISSITIIIKNFASCVWCRCCFGNGFRGRLGCRERRLLYWGLGVAWTKFHAGEVVFSGESRESRNRGFLFFYTISCLLRFMTNRSRKKRTLKKTKALVSRRGFVKLTASQDQSRASSNSQLPRISEQVNPISTATSSTTTAVWHFVQLAEHHTLKVPKSYLLHVMNNYQRDEFGNLQTRPGYTAVMIINVPSKSGITPVTCCSSCVSRELLGYFCLNDHHAVQFTHQHIFSCEHTTVAVQRTLATSGVNCSVRDDFVAVQKLAEILDPYQLQIQPGWHHTTGISSKGLLSVYITANYSMRIYGVEKLRSGEYRYYCHSCASDKCHHRSEITEEYTGNAPETVQYVRLPAKPLDNLISKQLYPCYYYT